MPNAQRPTPNAISEAAHPTRNGPNPTCLFGWFALIWGEMDLNFRGAGQFLHLPAFPAQVHFRGPQIKANHPNRHP
ncbi:hypothetical protein SAMN05421871_113153, partial [Actinokineospora alba]